MTFSDFILSLRCDTYPEPRQISHDSITSQVLEKLRPMLPEHPVVLDVGAGQGNALEWFKARKLDAQGISTNAEDLAACKAAGYVVSDVDMHDVWFWFQNMRFDLIFARHVMEHSPAPLFVLKQFHAIMKPGAILYVEVPAPDTACKHELNQDHRSVMGYRMWESLISKAGFENISTHQMDITTHIGPDAYFSMIARRP